MSSPRREVDDRLADWVDGRLSERERERMVAEMRVNPQLRADLEQYERTVGVLRAALRAPTVPSGKPMADRVLAAIAGERAALAERPSRWSKRHAWWSLASAAALLAGALWIDSWSAPAPSTSTTANLEEVAGAAKLADDEAKADAAPLEVRPGSEMSTVETEAQVREKQVREKQWREELGRENKVAEGYRDSVGKEPSKEPAEKEKAQALRTDVERSAAPIPDRGFAPPPATGQAPAAPAPAPAAPAGNPQQVVPTADGKALLEVAVPKDALRSAPETPMRGQPGGAGGGPGNPTGPATGGPETKSLGAPAAPASKPPADPAAADDMYLANKAREQAPAPKKADGAKAEAAHDEVDRGAAPAAPGAAVDKPAGRLAMLAFVEIEGVALAAPPTGGRGAMHRNKAETKDKDAPDVDASRGLATTPLAAPALQASLDQFLAAASEPAAGEPAIGEPAKAEQAKGEPAYGKLATGEPAIGAAAGRWVTTNGVLQVSPWIHAETPAPARPEEHDRRYGDVGGDAEARAAAAVTERTWLVEGDRKDVKLLLERVAAFARERKWTLRSGETAAPAEVRRGDQTGDDKKADAEKRVAETPAAEAVELLAASRAERVGADPMRVVLRIRLRPR